ncbi:MAG: CPBP family intramembrane metalloprotease [Clostridia bacterium]|nr:CPBP family intramembrane metalloprotease [Clostridia bacterium]
MKKFYEKNETLISLGLIVIYLITNSYCMNNFGLEDVKTLITNILLIVLIVVFVLLNKLGKYLGLTHFPKPKQYLYFIPLVMLMSVNLIGGINIKLSVTEVVIYMVSMVCVGFLEEIIFRGFLFQMIAKDNIKAAIIVTSITFGIGHIINLLNGAELIPTLLQICYAITTGYLFAVILVKSKSIWPQIITHSVVNALSVFNAENFITIYISPVILIIVPLIYALYLNKKIKE